VTDEILVILEEELSKFEEIRDNVRLIYEPDYVMLRVGNLTEENVDVSMYEFPTGL
jgi:hypothetical protein